MIKFRFVLGILLCISWASGLAQQPTWQWTKRWGCNTAYSGNTWEQTELVHKLKDSRGNQYLLLYITGDTFYYDDYRYKFFIRGGDGYALCKIKPDGDLAWAKIISHNKKSKASLQNFRNLTSIPLYFGVDENEIIFSGISNLNCGGPSCATIFYIDQDTALNDGIEFTIIYDSLGNAKKKFVNKPNTQGRSAAVGFFPNTKLFYLYDFVDSTATNRILYQGNYLTKGEYYITLDSNMNYHSFSLMTKKKFTTWFEDSTDAVNLTSPYSFMTKIAQFNEKVILFSERGFDPNQNIPRFIAIEDDTLRQYHPTELRSVAIFSCFNSLGQRLWTKFHFGNDLSFGANFCRFVQDGSEVFISLMSHNETSTYDNVIVKNSTAGSWPYDTAIFTYFKIDSNGNFLWKDSTYHSDQVLFSKGDVNSMHKLVWQSEVISQGGFTDDDWVQVNKKEYRNKAKPSIVNVKYTKSVVGAYGKGTQTLIDTTIDAQREVYVSHVVVDPFDNIYLHGVKRQHGTLWNNDSTLIIHLGTYRDNFIVKLGCSPLASSFRLIDSMNKRTIKVKYNGITADTVFYQWGDGSSSSITLPDTQIVTKTYGNTLDSVYIMAITKNSCLQYDTFGRWFVFCKDSQKFQTVQFCDSFLKLSIDPSPRFSFLQWSDGSVLSSKTINQTTTMTGVYKYPNGCQYRDSFYIKKYVSPVLQKNTSTLNCIRQPISLSVFNSDATAYLWNTGQVSSNIAVQSKGTYSVQINHPCGTFRDSFYIQDTYKIKYDTTRITQCTGFKWFDSLYATSGDYQRVWKNNLGCDSFIRKLSLKIGLNDKVRLEQGIYFTALQDSVSYQWYSCNPWRKIANETKRKFTTTSKSTYAVVLDDGKGCKDTSDCIALYSSGLTPALHIEEWLVYPNPARNYIFIESPTNNLKIIKLYDLLGQEILSVDVQYQNGKNQIDIGQISNGLYIIKVLDRSGEVIYSKKLIINK